MKETEAEEDLVTSQAMNQIKLKSELEPHFDSQPAFLSLLCCLCKVFKYIWFVPSVFKILHVRNSIEFGGLWEDAK